MNVNMEGNCKSADSTEEDVWGSWEEMEDSGALDERLEKELKMHQASTAHNTQSQSPMFLQEDTTRTAYQPRLKILKRPTESGQMNGEIDTNAKQNVSQTKTLAEREAAYAEARKRIMGTGGSDYPDEDLRQGPGVTIASPSSSRTNVGIGLDRGQSSQSKGKR